MASLLTVLLPNPDDGCKELPKSSAHSELNQRLEELDTMVRLLEQQLTDHRSDAEQDKETVLQAIEESKEQTTAVVDDTAKESRDYLRTEMDHVVTQMKQAYDTNTKEIKLELVMSYIQQVAQLTKALEEQKAETKRVKSDYERLREKEVKRQISAELTTIDATKNGHDGWNKHVTQAVTRIQEANDVSVNEIKRKLDSFCNSHSQVAQLTKALEEQKAETNRLRKDYEQLQSLMEELNQTTKTADKGKPEANRLKKDNRKLHSKVWGDQKGRRQRIPGNVLKSCIEPQSTD